MATDRRAPGRRHLGPTAWSNAHWLTITTLFALAAVLIVVRTAALAT